MLRTLRYLPLCLALPAAALAQEEATSSSPAPTPEAATASAAAAAGRPQGFSVGVGAGWTFPGDLLSPDTTSVRVRLGTITLEPFANLGGRAGSGERTDTVTAPGGGQSDKDENRGSGYTFALGSNVRVDLMSRGAFDFVGIVGGSLSFASDLSQEDVDDTTRRVESRETTTTASVAWGLGVVWFLRDNLSLSADATNPLLSYTRKVTDSVREVPVGDGTRTTRRVDDQRALSYGVVFNPTVRVLLHLYF